MLREEEKQLLKTLVVVYAEDDEIIREALGMSLKRKLKMVHLANNGSHALELIDEHKPNIILSDIEMPVLDGMKMAKKVREDLNMQNPIIALTAYNDDEHKSPYFTDYVYKPIDVDELYKKLLCFAK
ncbi:MAG: response regulator [Campylobacterales bacterium]|nr:response regulator [Campylobacterales bacterium]